MAPLPEAFYFPSLDICFSGDAQLISWKSAFSCLLNSSADPVESDSIYQFLTSPECVRIITNPFSPFSIASQTTKADFETKTAEIHVTGSQSSFNLDEIKQDALWLSNQCGIDEISALRIVILEWQGRSEDELLTSFSEEEITSLQDSIGITGLSGSGSSASVVEALERCRGGLQTQSSGLSAQEIRRLKIFLIFLFEKQHILKTAHTLLSVALRHAIPTSCDNPSLIRGKGMGTTFENFWRSVFGLDLTKDQEPSISITGCIDSFKALIKDLSEGSGWPIASDSKPLIESAWQANKLEEVVQVLQIMFLHLQVSPTIPSDEIILTWLQFMLDYSFLETLRPENPEQATLCSSVQGLIAVVTLAFLKLPVVKSGFDALISNSSNTPGDWLTGPAPFMSRKNVAEINEIYLQAASAGVSSASPAIFAWGIIMFAVREFALVMREDREIQQTQNAVERFNRFGSPISHSGRSMDQTIYEDIMDQARNPAFDEDFVKVLVSGAVDQCHVFDVIIQILQQLEPLSGEEDQGLTNTWIRVELLSLVRSSIEFLDYIPEVVSSILAILSFPNKHYSRKISLDPRNIFINDSLLMDRIFRVSKSRFPYESVNFLKICRTLSDCDVVDQDGLSAIALELVDMETYTQILPPMFQDYQPIREDENANYVGLLHPLLMKELIPAVNEASLSRSSNPSSTALSLESALVPAETTGQIVNETKPPIIMWYHNYNGFGFLGKWLEQAARCRSYDIEIDDETISEIIGLFADLISSAERHPNQTTGESGARRILEMASDELVSYGDLVSVVFEIFERKLQAVNSSSKAYQNLSTLISCLDFITGLVKILPGRVWPFLSRSSFISTDGKGGMLVRIVSLSEVVSGDFSFLLASTRLFNALVDDSLIYAAVRRSAGKVSAKTGRTFDFTAGVPSHIMRDFLLANTRIMVEVYNVNSTWRFDDLAQQLKINVLLNSSFAKIILYVYGVDDKIDLSAKLTGVFSESAQYLLNVLRPSNSEGFPLNPVLDILFASLEFSASTSHMPLIALYTQLVHVTLELSERLVQAGKFLKSPLSPFEKQLFKASPLLIRLYALSHDYRLPITRLFNLLLSYLASDPSVEPPSLFGSLGSESACRFLDIVSKFDRPFINITLYTLQWRLITILISSRQQWFAVFVLTGATPRARLKGTESKTKLFMTGRPFLAAALDTLSNLETIPPQVIIPPLEFISKAQDNWPWVSPELGKRAEFFPSIIKHVSSVSLSVKSTLEQCLNCWLAALVADICSVYIYSAKEIRDVSFFKSLRPLITWFANNAVEVNGYNTSLHSNLKRNFGMKYSGCILTSIKRTTFQQPEFGDGYFYDTELGSKLFGYDFAWLGTRGQGLLEEIKRANENMSLVEAQMLLLHSFKFFALEHCTDFVRDREIQRSMANVVHQCLVSNISTVPDENLFLALQQTRADFALGLLQQLVNVGSHGSEVFRLLNAAWDAVRLRQATYENALLNDDTEYYSSLLDILFLSLQFHLENPSRIAPQATTKRPEVSSDLNTVVDIVRVVIAQGFRSLTIFVHDEPQKCLPHDFVLLTALLQTVLKVRDVERIYEQISYHLMEADTARYAATLFSWAFKLTMNDDPIYGELSLLFLVELSCIPLMAEQLAVDSLLMKLSTSRLTAVLRQPHGFGPFDQIPRFYAIWNAGILPLCLNLIYHVSRVAPEVVSFLNQFEGQLQRASDSFSISGQAPIGFPAVPGSGILANSVSGITTQSGIKRISLSMASEACSLALIFQIVTKLREAGPSVGFDTQNIEELKWDKAQVKDDIEALLEKRVTLRSRIMPSSQQELRLAQKKPTDPASGCQDLLEEKVVKELQCAVMYMGG